MRKIRVFFLLQFSITCGMALGETVIWQFSEEPPTSLGRAFNVDVAIYGEDQVGVRSFNLTFKDQFGFSGIDPATIRFFYAGAGPALEEKVGEDFWSTSYLSIPTSPGQDAISEIWLGTLIIPEGTRLLTSNFRESIVTVASQPGVGLPTPDNSLPPNQVSHNFHGGDFHVDGDFHLTGSTVDFGRVPTDPITFSDIVLLEFIGFFGEVELQSLTISGPDADNFSFPDFQPTTLGGLQPVIPYDVSFHPDRLGGFEAVATLETLRSGRERFG